MHPEKDDCIDGSSTSRDAQPKTNRYVSDLFSQEKSQLHDSPGVKPGSIKTDGDHPFFFDVNSFIVFSQLLIVRHHFCVNCKKFSSYEKASTSLASDFSNPTLRAGFCSHH